MTKIQLLKDTIQYLRAADIPHEDFYLWDGVRALDPSAYKTLIAFLYTATKEEIHEMNSLLKKKVAALQSQDQDSLREIITMEKDIVHNTYGRD